MNWGRIEPEAEEKTLRISTPCFDEAGAFEEAGGSESELLIDARLGERLRERGRLEGAVSAEPKLGSGDTLRGGGETFGIKDNSSS